MTRRNDPSLQICFNLLLHESLSFKSCLISALEENFDIFESEKIYRDLRN